MENTNVEQISFNSPPSIDVEDLPTSVERPEVNSSDNSETSNESDNYDENDNLDSQETEEEYEEETPDSKEFYSKERSKADFNKIQRERHRFAHLAQQREAEALRLAQENEHLRQLAEEAYQASTFHLNNSLESKLKIARDKKAQAYEAGDVAGLTDADIEISKINYEIQEANKIKAQHDYYLQQQQQNALRQPSQEQIQHYTQEREKMSKMEALRWISDNPWANKKSTDYNQELDYVAETIATNVGSDFAAHGRDDLIMTRAYFDEIDHRMNQYLQSQQNNVRRPLNMKAPNVPVSSVRPGMARQATTRSSDGLSPEEREFAKMLGPSASKYFKKSLDYDKKVNPYLRKNANMRGGQ